MIGNNQAPVNVEAIPLKLLTEHKRANEVASFPGKVDFAIKLIIFKNINIPKILKRQEYIIAETGVKYK